MKFIDFFAGIGGFRKGLEDAGHKCVGFCEIDKFAIASYTAMHLATKEQLNYVNSLPKSKRVKEIVKDVYKNGEWSATDIRAVSASDIPKADCWCFGAPCQDFSIAGKRAGLNGDKSSLVREIFRLLEERKEEDRPEWIIYENVKGMLSSERGLNFLSILAEMDRLGYDAEWQNINSKWFVPQNRERIYTLGHFRARGFRKILPIGGTDGKSKVLQVASSPSRTRLNPNQGRTYSPDGIAPCLCTMKGGNLEPRIVTKTVGQQNGRITSEGVLNRKNKTSGVLVEQKPCVIGGVGEKNFGSQYRQGNRIYDSKAISSALNAHSAGGAGGNAPLIYNDEMGNLQQYRIRKLTPKECFRLQGWTDDYFEKAALVNSDSQLYKQAGNEVTVNVVREIGKRMSNGGEYIWGDEI